MTPVTRSCVSTAVLVVLAVFASPTAGMTADCTPSSNGGQEISMTAGEASTVLVSVAVPQSGGVDAPDCSPVSASITWGDGAVTGPSSMSVGGGLFRPILVHGTHAYVGSGRYTLQVTTNATC